MLWNEALNGTQPVQDPGMGCAIVSKAQETVDVTSLGGCLMMEFLVTASDTHSSCGSSCPSAVTINSPAVPSSEPKTRSSTCFRDCNCTCQCPPWAVAASVPH